MMNARTAVNGMLRDVGTSLGLNLGLRSDGLCVIKQEQSDFEYIIELSKTGDILYMYSPVGDLPTINKSDAMEYLLKLNLYGLETNQCSLGLDAKTNKIVLFYTIPSEVLNATLISNILCNFFTTVQKVSKKIEGFSQSIPQQSPEESDKFSSLLTMV
ncbi:MAG: type III secretion system chaperone [Puniceicoccales bacterium]|jgi:hypothetical protein|nr:type III secretion system chaperone [Puniceicoccales bacterium]